MKRILLFLLASAVLYGQSGPAGVGNSATNSTWLKPENLVGFSNNDKVDSWPDASGNSRDYANGDSNKQPLYKTSQLNGYSVVSFDGNDDYLRNYSAESGQDNFTVFIIAQTELTHQIDVQSNSGVGGTSGQFYLLDPRHRGSDAGMGVSMGTNGVSVYEHGAGYMPATAVYSGALSGYKLLGVRYTSRRPTIFVNSTISRTGVTSGRANVFGPQTIGDGSYGAFFGEVAELIIFNTSINDAQRLIVENYLSSKFNLSIGGNDKYSYEGEYGFEVSGIGRQSATASHLSASNGILNLNVSSLAADGQYLLFGHNNAENTSLTTISGDNFNNDAVYTRRLEREWRIDKTGTDLGAVNLEFDVSGLSLPGTGWSWVVFIDNNGDGDFTDPGDTYQDLQLAGNTASLSNVALNDGATLTLGAVQRVLGFATATSQGLESVEFPALNVLLNYAYTNGTKVWFELTVDAGADTTIAGVDFTTSATSDTLQSGIDSLDLNDNIALRVLEDLQPENTETVTLTLSGLANATFGSFDSHVYAILDNDQSVEIGFENAVLSQAEGDSDYILSLNFRLVSDGVTTETTSSTSIGLEVTGGSAVFGHFNDMMTDAAVYDTTAPSVGFACIDSTGVSTGAITFNTISGLSAVPTIVAVDVLRIRGDALFEDDETIELTLRNPFACALVAEEVMTITLTNDDTAPNVSFSSASAVVAEGDGSAEMTVMLSTAAGKDIAVSFSHAGGTPPVAGDDYGISPSPVTIPTGALSAVIEVSITQDLEFENNEQLNVVLEASAATIIAPSSQTLTIMDDDDFGSVGPAGVGSIESNSLWLKPESITGIQSSDPLSQWPDASGNDFHMNGEVSREPTYLTNQLNGFPVVDFEPDGATGDRMFNTSQESGINNFTIFLVARAQSSHAQDAQSNSGTAGTSGGRYVLEPRNRGAIPNAGMGLSLGTNGVSVYEHGSGYMPPTAVYNATMSGYKIVDVKYISRRPAIYVNGTFVRQGLVSARSVVYGPQSIGYTSTYGPFDGQVAELIIYNTVLNDGQRLVIDNHLSAKYNINIGSNDKYAGDQPALGDYDMDVAGIGTSDGTINNKHRIARASAGLGLNELNSSLNSAGEFVMVGHNTPLNKKTNEDLGSGLIEQRWSRSWYLDKTGSVDARLSFDFGDAGFIGVPHGQASNYVLLYRADTASDFAEVGSVSASIFGDQVYYDVANAQLTDGYYTLGTLDSTDSPLPVLLVTFSAKGKDRRVHLSWQTGSEQENLGFIVYRSSSENGEYGEISSYEYAEDLLGLGTSGTGKRYQFIDTDFRLLNGQTYYYKIADVDVNGVVTMHGPVSATPTATEGDEQVTRLFKLYPNYPNPFNPTTTIVVDLEEFTDEALIEVYDITGRLVKTLYNGPINQYRIMVEWDGTNNAGNTLSTGMYFYRYRSANRDIMRKMILMK
jgi:hypothetical protein